MNARTKQIIFIGLAVVLIAFTVIMLQPRGGTAVPASAVSPSSGASSQSGQPSIDAAIVQRINALQEQIQKDPKDARALTELGGLLFEAQQYARAADIYNRVLDLEPGNNAVRLELGKAYFWQGMSSTAVKEFKKVIEADPTKAEAHYQLALALSHGSPPDIDAAIAEWQQVIKLAPDSDIAKKSEAFINSYQKQK